MVVAVGLTFTGSPLVAGRLPGLITPVPFAKTPVSAVLVPVVMFAEFAVKLLMEGGGGGGGVLDDPPPHPLKPARIMPRVKASEVSTRRRFMSSPFLGQANQVRQDSHNSAALAKESNHTAMCLVVN